MKVTEFYPFTTVICNENEAKPTSPSAKPTSPAAKPTSLAAKPTNPAAKCPILDMSFHDDDAELFLRNG